MTARRLIAVLALLAAIPVLSGCGASDTLSPEAVAKAADATVAKGGVKIAIVQSFDVPGAGHLTTTGDGAVDTRSQTGHLRLKLAGLPGLPASAGSDGITQDVVIDHFVLYMRSPQFAALLGHGKTWLKLDLAKLGKAHGIDFSSLTQGGQDPTQTVRYLKAASGAVTKVGEEDIRGVPTTHYKATIDYRKYADTVPAANRAAVRASVDKIIQLSGTSMAPIDVWLDKDQLVRRVKQALTFKTPSGKVSGEQQFDLYDFGTKVDVTLPPANQVRDVGDLLAAAGAGGHSSGATAAAPPVLTR